MIFSDFFKTVRKQNHLNKMKCLTSHFVDLHELNITGNVFPFIMGFSLFFFSKLFDNWFHEIEHDQRMTINFGKKEC